jgi:hypothetical protein
MNEIVKRVPLDELGSPHEEMGGMLEVRFTNSTGATEVWMVPDKFWGKDTEGFLDVMRESGAVKLAYLDSGVDTRIGLLMEHVGFHHEGFKGIFPCGYQSLANAKTEV